MILKSNVGIVQHLRSEYLQLLDYETTAGEGGIGDTASQYIRAFDKQANTVETRFQLLQARIETYRKLLENRKDLVSISL